MEEIKIDLVKIWELACNSEKCKKATTGLVTVCVERCIKISETEIILKTFGTNFIPFAGALFCKEVRQPLNSSTEIMRLVNLFETSKLTFPIKQEKTEAEIKEHNQRCEEIAEIVKQEFGVEL